MSESRLDLSLFPAENVHEFPFGKLLSVLKSCHELHYRNYTLFNSVSEYMANTFDMWSNKQVRYLLIQVKLDLTFKEECTIEHNVSKTWFFSNVFQVILILVSFEDLLFRPVVLLDVFAERIIKSPDSLTLKDLLSVLKVFSLLNHDLKEKKTE